MSHTVLKLEAFNGSSEVIRRMRVKWESRAEKWRKVGNKAAMDVSPAVNSNPKSTREDAAMMEGSMCLCTPI